MSDDDAQQTAGTVFLVGAGPGAADLITVRGQRLLHAADCVVHDDLVDPALYRDLGVDLHDVGKRSGRHKMAQDLINELLVELAKEHRAIVRLKGGDPFVLGRGSEEALHLAANGVACEVVPGLTSATAAPLLAGIPVTHRGVADSFCVVSAHPRDADDALNLPAYVATRTVIVLMGARSMPRWRRGLLDLGYPATLPVAFVRWAGRPEQTTQITTLGHAEALADALRSPIVAIVGAVVAIRSEADQGTVTS